MCSLVGLVVLVTNKEVRSLSDKGTAPEFLLAGGGECHLGGTRKFAWYYSLKASLCFFLGAFLRSSDLNAAWMMHVWCAWADSEKSTTQKWSFDNFNLKWKDSAWCLGSQNCSLSEQFILEVYLPCFRTSDMWYMSKVWLFCKEMQVPLL